MKRSNKKLEIVLLEEVANLGEKGTKLLVAKGYAVNFLIPQGLAVLSSEPKAEKILKEIEEKEKKKVVESEKTKKLAEKLEGLKIKIKAKSGKTGKLFGSITKNDILKEIEKLAKIKLGKVEVISPKGAPSGGELPIKKPGEYQIKLKLASGVEPEIKIKVSAKNKK